MILMLTYNDWSNTGWRFSKCWESLGLEVEFYKGKKHRFGYPEQGPIHPALNNKTPVSKAPVTIVVPELKSLVESAPVVHFIASTFIDTGADLSNKTVIVQHGGATYRNNTEKVNTVLNPKLSYTIIQSPDLLGLGAKNEILISFPVDTDFIQPFFKVNRPLKIGHFPSNSSAKGTNTILKTIKTMNLDSYYVGKRKPGVKSEWTNWKDNLKRMAQCDIIIEKLQPELKRGLSGEWGNTALEAAALGKIVITSSHKGDAYHFEYGDHPLLIANNQKELETQLADMFSMSEKEILDLKQKTRQWAEDKHSIKSTGNRLMEKIYGYIDVDQK